MKSSGKRMKKLLRKLKLVNHDDFLVQLGEVLGGVFSSLLLETIPFHSAGKKGRSSLPSSKLSSCHHGFCSFSLNSAVKKGGLCLSTTYLFPHQKYLLVALRIHDCKISRQSKGDD